MMGTTSEIRSGQFNITQDNIAPPPTRPGGIRPNPVAPAVDQLVPDGPGAPDWLRPRREPSTHDGRFLRVEAGQTPFQAIQQLSDNLERDGFAPLVSRKVPSAWPSALACCLGGSVTVDQFNLGFYHQQACQRIITRPGRYPVAGMFRSWDREPTASLNETHIRRGDFNYVRLNQNTVAVVQEPNGETFILDQGLAVSFGNYRILERVQPNNLAAGNVANTTEYRENTREQPVLGYLRRVLDSKNEVAATFLQVQPNCVAVVSRDNQMHVLHSGAWMFTEKNISLRGFFNESLATHEMDEQTVRTADNIYVTLSLYLQWRLKDPLTLARDTQYDSPVAALKDGIEANVTHVVGKLNFQNVQGLRDTSGSPVNGQQQSKLLTDIQTGCFEELKERASSMGIELKHLEIRKNVLKGEIVNEMNQLALNNTRITNTASTIDRENANNMKAQENLFNVAQRQAQTRKAEAEGEASRARTLAEGQRDADITRAQGAQQAAVLAAEGDRQAKVAAARAQQEVLNLQTEAEVSRIRALAEAKRLEAIQVAEGKKAIADAEAYLANALGAVEDKFGNSAMRLASQRLQNENSRALSERFNVSIMPSSGANGELNPLLNAVISGSVIGSELPKINGSRAS